MRKFLNINGNKSWETAGESKQKENLEEALRSDCEKKNQGFLRAKFWSI